MIYIGGNSLNSFIVMQGETYDEEKKLGIIWAPQLDKLGKKRRAWLRVKEVKKNDRIFHYVKGFIVAISIAKDRYQNILQSPINKSTDEAGYLVDLEYHELDIPLHIRDHFDEIYPLLPIENAAFQENSDGNPGYLYPCNEELTIKFLDLISAANIYQVEQEQLELSIDYVRRIERNTLIPVIMETESEVKNKMCAVQREFRKRLLPLWNHQCVLCSIDLPELLRTSYSKQWRDSTNVERLDPYNGLLFCHNHGVLYEKGLIGFDTQGGLQISSVIKEEDFIKYGLIPKMKIAIYEENKAYIKWHRKHVFNEVNE